MTPTETLRAYRAHDYTLPGAVASRAAAAPERVFLMCNGQSWNWRSVEQLIERTARALAAKGVKQGDRVGVMARNSEKHFILLAALARLRAIMVPTNPDFGAAEVGFVFEHAQVCAVACDAGALPAAQEACRSRKLSPWFVLFDARQGDIPSFAEFVDQGQIGRAHV